MGLRFFFSFFCFVCCSCCSCCGCSGCCRLHCSDLAIAVERYLGSKRRSHSLFLLSFTARCVSAVGVRYLPDSKGNLLTDAHIYRGKNRYGRRLQTTDQEKKCCICQGYLCALVSVGYDDFCAPRIFSSWFDREGKGVSLSCAEAQANEKFAPRLLRISLLRLFSSMDLWYLDNSIGNSCQLFSLQRALARQRGGFFLHNPLPLPHA